MVKSHHVHLNMVKYMCIEIENQRYLCTRITDSYVFVRYLFYIFDFASQIKMLICLLLVTLRVEPAAALKTLLLSALGYQLSGEIISLGVSLTESVPYNTLELIRSIRRKDLLQID